GGGGGTGHGCSPQSPRCSTIGPSANTGRYVRPTTITITDTSRPVNSGVSVGNVPDDSGTVCLRASQPAMASAAIMRMKRRTSMHTENVVLNQSVLPLRPPNADPLLLAVDV